MSWPAPVTGHFQTWAVLGLGRKDLLTVPVSQFGKQAQRGKELSRPLNYGEQLGCVGCASFDSPLPRQMMGTEGALCLAWLPEALLSLGLPATSCALLAPRTLGWGCPEHLARKARRLGGRAYPLFEHDSRGQTASLSRSPWLSEWGAFGLEAPMGRA